MRQLKIILGLAVLVLVITAGWQIGSAEVANMNLQEEIRDMASQAGTHLGIVVPKSDDDVRDEVVRKAKEHGIDLQSDQVTVRRINPGEKSILHVSADYTVPVNLLLFSFNLHFAPSSDKKGS
jgi:type III secretion system FlhB-like substrate exporter